MTLIMGSATRKNQQRTSYATFRNPANGSNGSPILAVPHLKRLCSLAMHEFFTFLEETYTPILGQWEKRRARQARRQEDA